MFFRPAAELNVSPLARKLAITATAGIRIPAWRGVLTSGLFDRDGRPAEQFRQLGGTAFRAGGRLVASDQKLELFVAFWTLIFVNGHAFLQARYSLIKQLIGDSLVGVSLFDAQSPG